MNEYEKKLQDLECGKSIVGDKYVVTRVPGGWIFKDFNDKGLVFVPIPGINSDVINVNGTEVSIAK